MSKKLIIYFLPLLFSSGSFFFSHAQALQTWETFNETNSGLANNTIRCLLIDHNNSVWIGTDNGLSVLTDGNWETFNSSNSALTDNYIRALAVDEENKIWIGTTLGGVFTFDGVSWENYSTFNSDIPDNFIRSIAIDSTGKKWIGTVEGLTCFNDISWQTWTIANSGIFSNNISAIGIGHHNEKFIGTVNGGLIYIDSANLTLNNYTILSGGVPDNSTVSVQIDNLGKPWFACPAAGIFTDTGNQTWLTINSTNSELPTNSLTTMVIDRDQNFIIGSHLNGLIIRHYNNTWDNFTVANSSLPENHILSVAKDSLDNIWVGTYSSGLVKLKIDHLGIAENNGKTELKSYPNPAFSNSTISISRYLNNPLIQLLSTEGKIIEQQQFDSQTNFVTLPVVPPGTYILKIEEENQTSLIRILVN